MAFSRKMLYGASQMVASIKSWCEDKFALKSHTHTGIDNMSCYITDMSFTSNRWTIKFSNGFCIAGGIGSFNITSARVDFSGTITMHVTFKSTDYVVMSTLKNSRGGAGSISTYPKTTNTIGWLYDHSGGDSISGGLGYFYWEAKGYIS